MWILFEVASIHFELQLNWIDVSLCGQGKRQWEKLSKLLALLLILRCLRASWKMQVEKVGMKWATFPVAMRHPAQPYPIIFCQHFSALFICALSHSLSLSHSVSALLSLVLYFFLLSLIFLLRWNLSVLHAKRRSSGLDVHYADLANLLDPTLPANYS